MADEDENHQPHLRARTTTDTLPLRPHSGENETMSPPALTAVAPGLASPGISVEFHGDPNEKPALIHPRSAPPDVQRFQSPMRHHRRTPSVHREIKETLNARSEYTSDDSEGYTHHRINQYVIREEIGRGSYGAVHLATDQFGREYAVKAFSKTRLRKRAQSNILRQGPRHFGRFPPRAGFGAPDVADTGFSEYRVKEAKDALFFIREEVAIMKKLNHPNLVQLIEVLDDPEEDTMYMVLEMCKKGVVMKVGLGESANPYPEETCRHWFRDLILGIEYLHSQGVVHRDIKPENLLLTEDDVLKIVDFGVSEMFEKSKDVRTSKSAGSPAFLPPELCVAKHGDVSGRAADIWSMGVSLYCLRYGRIPFERSGVLDMYEAIRTESPQFPPDENPEFVDLMGRLMEKDPEKRIKMPELRVHSWVTKGGKDPLLSAEENCADPVDPPNPLELNHAFTRRMTHLICVMKAINKFKSLLTPKDPTTGERPSSSTHLNAHAHESFSGTSPSPTSGNDETSTAEYAARLLREREQFLASVGRASLDQLGSQQPHPFTAAATASSSADPVASSSSGFEPRLLGIGTGGIDSFGSDADLPAADVVSDSPTAVDFNVYDRAFEAEVERIRRSASSRTNRNRRGPNGEGGRIYGTRLVEQHRVGDENEPAAEAGGEIGERVMTPRSLSAAARVAGRLGRPEGRRFAELVARAMADAKSTDAGAPAGGEGRAHASSSLTEGRPRED